MLFQDTLSAASDGARDSLRAPRNFDFHRVGEDQKGSGLCAILRSDLTGSRVPSTGDRLFHGNPHETVFRITQLEHDVEKWVPVFGKHHATRIR
jgi:hypothetical protein